MKKNSLKKWFVIYTKSRNELRVTERLSCIGIEVYTPTRVEVRQWSDRKKKIIVPLLPSMVLVCLKENEVDRVFDVPGVVRYLFEKGKRAVVFDKDVLAMRSYLDNQNILQEKCLAIGDSVKVPLLDQEATILSLKGKNCIAQLKKLGAVVSFQLK